MKRFDAIIIGTGQAGPSLATRFAGAGRHSTIIERHKFGGTSVQRYKVILHVIALVQEFVRKNAATFTASARAA
jgi:pyruvate/2-oxoglutarate dehydrogenase complex dihydrolipoamide dehydrogenase (E3) component